MHEWFHLHAFPCVTVHSVWVITCIICTSHFTESSATTTRYPDSVLRVGIFKYMATTTTKVSRFRDQSYGWESSIYGNNNNKSIQIQGSVLWVGIFRYMATTTTKVSGFREYNQYICEVFWWKNLKCHQWILNLKFFCAKHPVNGVFHNNNKSLGFI